MTISSRNKFTTVGIVGFEVNILELEDVVNAMCGWIEKPDIDCHQIIVTGFHGLWEALKNPEFRFLAGKVKRVPEWIGDAGFEGAWRLAMEPGKLWRRDFIENPQFPFSVVLELLGSKSRDGTDRVMKGQNRI